MIQVSSDYISNATSPARQARMSVNVGGHTYGNSVIERLEYSHAIQDGGFSLGGAYSARLHVTLFANGASDIEIGDEVNAYASFDGSGDNCTLGIFYVTNVSQYRNRLKITAYDKIGLLGMTYIYKPASWGGYPGTGNVVLGNILEDILREHNLTKHPNYMMWAAYANTCYCVLKPDYVPKCYSVREMLGFLAGTSGGICTVSRSGYLSLLMPGSPVYLSDTNFHVERDNYYS
ncbi:MAG: hypothetical protein LBN40_05675, partial [Oscillospiraceae bacterium]|nr:hypothetical protein [Oscillospiraceae bacterium]